MEELAREVYKLVSNFCNKWNIHDDEVTQDLVYKTWLRMEHFDESKGTLGTFVFLNCRNFYLQSLQAKKIFTISYDEAITLEDNDQVYLSEVFMDDFPTPLEKVILEEKNEFLRWIIDNKCSDVMKLYLEGYTKNEIAKMKGCSQPNISARIISETRKLREAYGE